MPLAAATIDEIATKIAEARLAGRRIDVPDHPLTDAADVDRIQDAILRRIGPVGGWKTGPAAAGEMQQAAPIPARRIFRAPSRTRIVLGKPVGIELEIAVRIGRAFAAGAPAPSDAAVTAAISSVHVAIELCDTRFRSRETTPLIWRRADTTVNEGLVIGPEIARPFEIDFPRLAATLEVNGAVEVQRTGGLAMVDLRPVAGWMVRHAVAERGGVAEGTFITTGSWTGMQFFAPPAHIRGTFAGIGAIEIDLA